MFRKYMFMLLLSLPALALANADKDLIDQKHKDQAQAFYNQLPETERRSLNLLLESIHNTREPLIRISTNASTAQGLTYVLVQGLGFLDHDLWEPFEILKESQQPAYFFQWSKRDSLNENYNLLKESIKQLLQKDPQNQIVVFGFSAGGVLALKAWDELMSELPADQFNRLNLRNVVAVSHGYGMPKRAALAIPFVGRSTISISWGIDGQLKNALIQRCQQWITTNGDLDVHARANEDGRSPQILTTPACGSENIQTLPDDGHFSALSHVLRTTIQEDSQK